MLLFADSKIVYELRLVLPMAYVAFKVQPVGMNGGMSKDLGAIVSKCAYCDVETVACAIVDKRRNLGERLYRYLHNLG